MRSFLLVLALVAASLSLGFPAHAEAPADDPLLLEIAAVDRGFTPTDTTTSATTALSRVFELSANPRCSNSNDCPCPDLCQCVSAANSDKFCLCQVTCCATPDCA